MPFRDDIYIRKSITIDYDKLENIYITLCDSSERLGTGVSCINSLIHYLEENFKFNIDNLNNKDKR